MRRNSIALNSFTSCIWFLSPKEHAQHLPTELLLIVFEEALERHPWDFAKPSLVVQAILLPPLC